MARRYCYILKFSSKRVFVCISFIFIFIRKFPLSPWDEIAYCSITEIAIRNIFILQYICTVILQRMNTMNLPYMYMHWIVHLYSIFLAHRSLVSIRAQKKKICKWEDRAFFSKHPVCMKLTNGWIRKYVEVCNLCY